MYGIIPNAKIDALEKAPPTNASNRPNIPPFELLLRFASLLGSIPGKTIKEPRR